MDIGQDTRTSFTSSLPGGFHHLIKKTVETTHVLKRGAKIKGKTVYGLDAVFVPPSLIDQYGCIRKRSKAVRKGLGARTFRKRRSLISQWNIDSLDSVLGRTVLLGETCSQRTLLLFVPPLSERKHLVECSHPLHVQRAHLQMLLWKAADKSDPPDVQLTDYGWEGRNMGT